MMTARDYLDDAKNILLRRYSYRQSELAYLVREVRDRPRCFIGLHYPEFDLYRGRSYMDPGEPGWACEACDQEPCYRLRDRLLIWFTETRLGQWYAYDYLPWLDVKLGRACKEHGFSKPCEFCEQSA